MKFFILFFCLIFTAKSNNEEIINAIQKIQKVDIVQPIFPRLNQVHFKKINKNKLLSIDSADFEENIKRIIDERYNSIHPNVRQGISFSLMSENTGQFNYSVGFSDNETPLTPDMPLQVASITKVFVATLIFKLQEEGKLTINDKVSDYLTLPSSVNSELTIQNLLNHSSEIYDIFNNNQELYLSCYVAPNNVPELDFIIQNLPPLSFPEGVEHQYSNTNYTLLGKIIEQVSEKPLNEYLSEVILTPLELNNTFFLGQDEEPTNMADGWFEDNYNFFNISRVREYDLSKLYEIGFAMANIVATPEDVAKFGYNLMNGNIISESSLEQMTQQFAFDAQSNTAFGNGIFYSSIGELDCYQHSGSLLGYQSYLWTIPELDVSFSFVVNNASGGWAYNDNGMQKLLEAVLFEIVGFENPENYGLEFSSFDLNEQMFDNKIDNNEKVKLFVELRDQSQKYKSFLANIYLDGETHKIEDSSPIIIDTIYSDGYSKIEQFLEFSVLEGITGDVKLELVIDDINGEAELIKLPFTIPVNQEKKSLRFGSFENRVETIANTYALDNAWTVEADFKLNSNGKDIGIGQTISTIFAYTQTLMALTVDGRLAISMITENGQNPIYLHQPLLEKDKWYHLAVSYDGTSEVEIYVDKKKINAFPINLQNPGGPIITFNPRVFVIGNGPNKSIASFPFDGSIDNFRVWNRVLNENEISKSLSSSDDDDLYFAYDFNTNFNRNVKDISGTRNGVRYSLFDIEKDASLSVERTDLLKLNVYPMPANDLVNIQSEEIIESIILVDLLGNKILEKNNVKSNKENLDLTNLNIGTYVLIVKGKNTTQTKKIIVE